MCLIYEWYRKKKTILKSINALYFTRWRKTCAMKTKSKSATKVTSKNRSQHSRSNLICDLAEVTYMTSALSIYFYLVTGGGSLSESFGFLCDTSSFSAVFRGLPIGSCWVWSKLLRGITKRENSSKKLYMIILVNIYFLTPVL